MNYHEREDRILALNEASRETYPRSPFEGVPAYRPYIAPIGNAPELSKSDERLLVELTQRINRILMSAGTDQTYFTQLLTQAETDAATMQAVQAVMSIAKDDASVHIVCPLAGALGLARLAQNFGLSPERIHALEISGSAGTSSGSSTVKEKILPPVLLDQHTKIIILDDVGDTYTTMRALNQLRNADGDNPILAAPVFSKNHDMLQKISREPLQAELFQRYSVLEIENVWALGARMLDTGVLLSRIVDNDGRFSRFINPPTDDKHPNEWLLRIGTTIPGLAYLDPAKHHEEEILKLASRELQNLSASPGQK